MMSDVNNNLTEQLPKYIQELLSKQLSKEVLLDKIKQLSDDERNELEKIKKELGIDTDEGIIDYMLYGLKSVVMPDDRKLLSKPLMRKIEKLERISYASELRKFKETCDNSSDDLYTIIMGTLHKLWVKRYEKEEAYKRFEIYKDFEKVLFKDPRYRDHFIHQFQVFLSGLPIIDRYYDNINNRYKSVFGNNVNIEFSWLLSATFHDIGYLVQQFDKWLNSFFGEFLEVSSIPVNLDLNMLLLTRNFQEYINKLSSLYSYMYNGNEQKWKYSEANHINYKFMKLLMKKLLEERNHGVISSLILLDRIENSKIARNNPNYIDNIFSSIVMPSALSIALHDKGIFLDDITEKLEFEKDPLSFILIYCDTIQEWGRPLNPIITADAIQKIPHLCEYDIDDNKITVTLCYEKIYPVVLPNGRKKTTYELKEEEIKNVFKKIKSNNPIFEITLRSIDREYDFPESTYRSR